MKIFPQFKPRLSWLGRALMLAGLFFVTQHIWAYKEELAGSASEPRFWLFIMMSCILYGLAGILLSYGWLSLLRAQTQDLKPFILTWKEAWSLYGKTQIAKYIPGNVFHIAGRHALANQKGVSHSQLFVAAFLEILLVLVAAGIISLLAFSQISREMDNILFFVAAFFLAGVVLVFIVWHIGRTHEYLKMPEKLQWHKVVVALSSYLAFFIISSILFLFTIMIVSGQTAAGLANWPLIIGGYAFAWAVGFIVPGAPGGIGIREATLLALLSTSIPVANLLLGVLAFRLITTLGDIVFFVVSVAVQKYNLKK